MIDVYIYIYWYAVWLRVQVHSSLTHPFEVASTMANGNMASSMGSGFIAQLEARRCRLWDCGHGEIMWECCEIWSENRCCICFQLKRFETCCHAFFSRGDRPDRHYLSSTASENILSFCIWKMSKYSNRPSDNVVLTDFTGSLWS